MFICFTGIDGSGKSTLARALVAELEARGIRSQYVYSRFRPTVIKPVVNLGHALFLRDRDVYQDYSGYSDTRKAIFRNSLLSFIYERLLLLDYCLQVVFRVRVPLIRGKSVVCDRYTYDTVITDLAVDINYSQGKIAQMLKYCFLILPKPDIVFLVDVPEEVAFYRKNDVPSIDYLKDRRKIYLDVSREHNIIILDGTKDLESLMLEIRERIFK